MSETLTTIKNNDGSHAAAGSHTEELRRKYTAAKSAVADLAGEVSKTAKEQAGDLKLQASDWMHDKADLLREQLTDSQAAMITLVRRNPVKAVAIAAGAGLLLGLLVRSRR
jgi:ElaB/YqjD/DUF883 family membrane-anchored ribosome-binding protein